MIWKLIILLLLLLFCWILFAPVIVKVNTNLNNYRILLPGVFILKFEPIEKGLFLIRGWIFMVPFKFNPFRMKEKKRPKKDSSKNKAKNKWRGKGNILKLKKASKAIRIRKLELDIDSDDFLFNAWLVPAFSMVNRKKNIDLRVNFEGRLFFNLDMRTRFGSILWLFITNK